MIAIRNLLFQPLTLQLAGTEQGLHLNPREQRTIAPERVSAEIEKAARRGLIVLEDVAKPSAAGKRRTAASSKSPAPRHHKRR